MNKIQKDIIELLNKRDLTYSEIYKNLNLRSNLFNYHLKILLEKELIGKCKNKYELSSKGQSLYPYLKIKKQPIIAIVLIITKENNIVLIKRDKPAFKGYWALPGGKVNFGETIEAAIKRICSEETGLKVKNSKYITTIQEIVKENNKNKYHFILLLYKIKTSDGIKNEKLFSLDSLPSKIIPSDKRMLEINETKSFTSIIEDKNNKLKQEYFG